MREVSNYISVTPAMYTTTTAYSIGDQIGGVNTLTGAIPEPGGTGYVVSVSVVDKNKTKAALNIAFFKTTPAPTSVDNEALAITDANFVAQYLGEIAVTTGAYVDAANQSHCSVEKTVPIVAPTGSMNIVCIVTAQSAASFGSSSDLQIGVGIMAD